jgi:5-methylcytosine-specific restriction endonuclease McrA
VATPRQAERKTSFPPANRSRCEYCLIHQDDAATSHQGDHVVAEKHGGATTLDNLALSCFPCNWQKGSDIGAIDPESGKFVRLFDPRQQDWASQFKLEEARIVGRTAEGRATVAFLQ